MTRVFLSLDETPHSAVTLHINGCKCELSTIEFDGLLHEMLWARECIVARENPAVNAYKEMRHDAN